ncbi:sulfatase [Streptomyces caniscabiei]|uniref:Sulfatase n=1 Tax=Streptomyces caniscabiei TaxID=2746961 RepID=A0ABU4N1A5_9ACTN|nr:sulfatase [Streptomyces caniscabiei]MBE4734516.1 sulfatase [Streptomyces caniscabiei]MBE4755387.1 sulfatase [Streptomyces caniscabiei]MBE4772489.1 sulfatase [Streptomyces caniscabiei]MBE4783328.1 sulfatase [Streptomyces caniscabiei]MBE4792632.1 sulfatase [Streptomyces caniscabiei]
MSHIRSPQLPGPTPTPDDDKAPKDAAPPKRDAVVETEQEEPGAATPEAATKRPEQRRSDAGAEAEVTKPEAETAETEPEPESKPESKPKPESEPGKSDGSTPDPEVAAPEPSSGPEPDAEPGPEAKSEPEPHSETDAEPEPHSEAEAEPEPRAEAKDEPDAEAEPEPRPEPERDPDPQLTASASSPSPGWRSRHPRAARGVAWAGTGLALLLVLLALVVPNDITELDPGRFLRIPAEGILVAGLLLVLPAKARRIAVVVVGVVLGLLTIVKVLDMGSYWTLDRPFDLVLDWILLDDAQSFMKDSLGGAVAQAATVGVIVLALALPVLMTLAVVRLSRLMVRNRHTTSRTLLVLGTAWITCSTLTLEISDVPVASHSAATLVENRIEAVSEGLKDGEAFRKQAAVDAFADVPPDQLLTGLRGKDVLITFIESYGRSAIDDPRMGEPLGDTLAQKTQELKDAGFASRSGWLRSPITGAGSWLGHSTFLSGLWIKNQSRYNNLVASDRLTLTEAFRRTGAWRTVGIVPGTQMAWPEGKYFGLDHIYDSDQLGYQGPKFSWSTMPDQYTLKAFRELEHGREGREPMMAEIILTSSHNPWAPIPSTIPEEEIGDGSVYHSLQKAEGKNPTEVWKDPLAVRDEYLKSIQYSVTSIVDFVAKYGSEDTVLVFLGDHQPNKTVTGDNPSHDVPVSIVAKDPDVLEKIADWGWTDGLKPADSTPTWRMDKFRDRFMTAFGPQQPGGATP